ncbi:MAG: ABC-F family ATP-binding cassette domain-containing protein [Henriciella sp.]
MLTIHQLDYRIEARSLFENASAQIAAGWKVGLVGRNGTGKSTLLRLILEEIDAPSRHSSISLNKGARVGVVTQEVAPDDKTIMEVVLAADTERSTLMAEADTATDPMRIAEIHARLVDIDAWSADARAAEILAGLGFSHADLTRPAREFSGGWRMRAALAGVLFSQPELLLLDEPTNYLDLEGAAWLEGYLRKYPYTVILVSHDRDLLNRSVTHTMALENRQLFICPGGYDDWLKLRAEKSAQIEAQRQKQEADRAHLQAFVDRFRYKLSKARQAQSRIKRLEKMQEISVPLEDRTVPFTFQTGEEKLLPPMLVLESASMGYGPDAEILSDVNLRIDPEDRIAIVGTNGQGKTTLVKSIAERLPLMAGQRVAPRSVRVGYFSQDQMDELVSGQTILEHISAVAPKQTPMSRLRSICAELGFSHEKVETRVENLSGGEKVRLLLGLMTFEKPHILILDEPTSHLDIDSREALIYALNDYQGAVVLITHDIFLAEATADQLWLVKDGRAVPYAGTLQDYRDLVLSADRPVETTPKATKLPAETPSVARIDKAELRRQASERRKQAAPLKKKAQNAERALDKAMTEIAAIDLKLSKEGLSSSDIQAMMVERSDWQARADASELEWLEAEEAYEEAIRTA